MTKRPSFFSYGIHEESIALITLDLPGENINKLSTPVMNELESLIEKLGFMNNLSGAIFLSKKPNIFIAGADIREIQAAQTNIESGRAFLRYGQSVFNKVSELPFPTCAAIDGACMGGGLEFSLSCDYRVISTNPKAQLALPEVKLGIMPGWGGSQRMPRLIGLSHSIDLICSGRSVGTQEAFQIGLVDDYSWPDSLQDSAINMITSANTDSKWKHRRQKLSSPLQINDGERLSIFNLSRERITREAGSHYPAPITALEAIEEGYFLPLKEGLEIELQKIDYLLETPVSQNLIHLFFLSKELEKKVWVDKNTAHSDIANVGILGAGIMGQGIAAANITRNIPVTLSDSNQELLNHGLSKVIDIVSHDKHLSAQRKEYQYTAMSRLNGSIDHSDLKNAQLLIEAVTEDPNIKTKLYEQVEEHISPHCILASNTTSISITKLSANLKHKNRFIGLHFFNPVQKMKLVEVIRSPWTSEECVASIVRYVRKLGKIPIVINDGVGFITSRLLFIYLNEAVILLEEGVSPQDIEKAMLNYGMPMGPLLLLDLVGIDVAYKTSLVMREAYPDRYPQSTILQKLYDLKRFGMKTGSGFYLHSAGESRPQKDPNLKSLLELKDSGQSLPETALTERMILPMILEAARILQDNISSHPSHIDLAMILGINFPAFRGGPLKYADSLGTQQISKAAKRYESLGKRFEPCEYLKSRISEGKLFYT